MVWDEAARNSPFAEFLGIEITDIRPGYAEGRLELEPHHGGPPAGGVAHGGVISAFADHMGAAATTAIVGRPTPTIDMRMDYLNPAIGDRLEATAETRRNGGTFVPVEVEIFDEDGRDIAVGRSVFKLENDGETQWSGADLRGDNERET